MNAQAQNRREFLKTTAAAAAAVSAAAFAGAFPTLSRAADKETKEPLFKISLAQWSLHKSLFNKKLDNLDFAKTAEEMA